MTRTNILYLCLAITLSLSSICAASIRIESLTAGLDGYVRAERWAPVVVELQNNGNDFQGTLELLKGETIFRKSLDLAEGSQKRVELIYYHSSYFEPISIRILDAKGRVLNQQRLDVRLLNYQDNLVLVLSDDTYSHQFLNGQQNPWGGKTFVAYMKSGALPSEWIAYSSADAIAIGSLSPAQLRPQLWNAIVQYAASGNILIFSAATSAAVLQDPLIRENIPGISPNLNRMSNGNFLISKWASRSSEEFPTFAVPAQTLVTRPCDRQLVVAADGVSLITSSPFFKGNIIYFSFDYSRLPEHLSIVFANFWNDLIHITSASPPVFSKPFRKRLEENARIQKFLYDVPGLRLPDVKWFSLFFFVYLCAIGPFQFLVLKVLKKNSLLWITFPAIILIFSAVSFGYSRFRHSAETRITQAVVQEIFPSLHTQTTYQVYGMAAGNSGTFEFQAVPENSFLRKFAFESFTYQPEPYQFSEDLPRKLVGETLKNWAFRTFDGMASGPPSIEIDVRIQVHGDEIRGQVTNLSDQPLQESFFLYDMRNAVQLGLIPADATRSFSLRLNSTSVVPFAEPQLRDLLDLYNLSYANPHFFFARIDGARGELVVNGTNRPTVCTKYIAVYVETKDAGPVHGWTPALTE